MKIHSINKLETGAYMVNLSTDNTNLQIFFDSVEDKSFELVVTADLSRNGVYVAGVWDDIATELVEFATNEGILK